MINKPIRSLMSVLLAGALFLGGAVNVFAADAELKFGKANDQFVFDFADGDALFSLANIMPGDSEVRTIDLSNNYSQEITLFVQANAKTASTDLLDQLKLTVKRTINSDTEILYSGVLSGKVVSNVTGNASMISQIQIGKLAAGQTGTLELTVTAPETLGNAYADARAEIDWIFTAQAEESTDPDPVPNPSSSRSSGGSSVQDTVRSNVSTTTINDGDIPLSDGLSETFTTIDDEAVPLGNLPKTGGSALVFFLNALDLI